MDEKQRATIILKMLRNTLTLPKWPTSKSNPFGTLVATVLSQNTSDVNAAKAFEALSNVFEISPEVLAKANILQIEKAIRPAGLFKSKSKAIKQTASCIVEQYHGSLSSIFSLSLDEARNALMQFPGVGPKTADVVLLFSAAQPTIPVDTHVSRVAKRLGFAPQTGNYETVRLSLQAVFDPADDLAVHLLLIAHGRKICKALRPLCGQCPVCDYCPSCGKWEKP